MENLTLLLHSRPQQTSFEGLLCARLWGGAVNPVSGAANGQTEKHRL